MKKWAVTIAVLWCMVCIGAWAEEYLISSNRSVNVTVRMEISESYQQVIPADLTIAYGAESVSLGVRITELHLLSSDVLQVSASTEGKLVDPEDASNFIAFSVHGEGETEDNAACLLFDDVCEKQLTVSVAREEWRKAVSGCTYDGIITFQFSVIPKVSESEGGDTLTNE